MKSADIAAQSQLWFVIQTVDEFGLLWLLYWGLPLSVNTVWVILGIPGVSGEQKAMINLVIIDEQKPVPAATQEALQI